MKVKKSEIAYLLLRAVAPGGHDAGLDSQEVYGPRGGIRGTKRVGLGVPAWLSRVISRGGIRHGQHYYYMPGFRRRRARLMAGGKVLPDTPAVRGALNVLCDERLYRQVASYFEEAGLDADLDPVITFALLHPYEVVK
ncbi:MAG: hypothetical protein AB1330_01520 [Bacillota bacterium]